MIDWGLVAAYIGPLLVAIGLVAGWFSYQQRRREKQVRELIREATADLVLEQRLTRDRLTQMEAQLTLQARHLDKQDDVLSAALQAIARIEGRLAGPLPLSSPG